MFLRALIIASLLTSPLALPLGEEEGPGVRVGVPQAQAFEVPNTSPHPQPLSRKRARGAEFRAFASSRESSSTAQPTKPQRIVSTNVCADQLALALVDRARILSVSRMATEPEISNYANEARGLRVNSARAEEIVELKPDLILGDIYTGKGANRLAATIGVPVHIVGYAASLDDVRNVIRDAAAALGESERGERLIAAMNSKITSPETRNPNLVTALVYEPNGLTSGAGTLTNDILAAAGLTNIAPKLTNQTYATVALETVVAAAPQLLILDDSYGRTSSRAQAVLRHPAFRALKGKTKTYAIPSRLWLCPGPWVGDAVERLAAERARLARAVEQE